MAEVRERPILFSGPMVRAILDGRKSQTRRVVKHHLPTGPCNIRDIGNGPEIYGAGGVWLKLPCPYGQPGDRLWVRETWRFFGRERNGMIEGGVEYRTGESLTFRDFAKPRDVAASFEESWRGGFVNKWKASIHMPRWASRLTLEITDVRVERLGSISHEDALAEGVAATEFATKPLSLRDEPLTTAQLAFSHLWESINGPGSWEANPWCWAISFKRLEVANG